MLTCSVIINNFNYADFVCRSIRSVLAQHEVSPEIIVVDDGSTDSSCEKISQFGASVIPCFKSNGGQASAFNAGYRLCTGEVIFLLDSDDFFLPKKLKTVLAAYERYPEIGWCFHNQLIGKDGCPLPDSSNSFSGRYVDERGNFRRGRPSTRFPATSALSFRRRALSLLLPMPEAKGVGLGDHYLKFGAASLFPGFYFRENFSVQTIHDRNHYTLQSNGQLEAEILAGTALALRERIPATAAFCDNLIGTASIVPTGKRGSTLSRLISNYRAGSTWPSMLRTNFWMAMKIIATSARIRRRGGGTGQQRGLWRKVESGAPQGSSSK